MIEHVLSPASLSLVLTWFSPSLPVGAFAYSHGLERLNEDGLLAGADAVFRAVGVALAASGRNDAILLAHAFRAAAAGDAAGLAEVRELALALAASAERREETVIQGTAFSALGEAVWPGGTDLDGEPRNTEVAVDRRPRNAAAGLAGDVPLPVAVGIAGAAHGLPLPALAHAYLSNFAASLVSAAVRLVPLGQTDGQRVTARLAPAVAALAAEAVAASLDEVGAAAVALDIAAMRHEVQEVRLFRS